MLKKKILAAATWWPSARSSYASIIWIRFMGLWRSRATLSAFVPAPADTGWLPGDNGTLGRQSPPVKGACARPVLADGHRRQSKKWIVRFLFGDGCEGAVPWAKQGVRWKRQDLIADFLFGERAVLRGAAHGAGEDGIADDGDGLGKA